MLMSFEDALNDFKPKDESELLVGYDKSGEIYGHSFLEKGSLIIGGTTGAGMAVMTSQMILSGMFNYNPEELQFAFYDPSRVEYGEYKDSPFTINKIMSEADEFKAFLKDLDVQIKERSELFADVNVSNIKEYNAYAKKNDLEVLSAIITLVDRIEDFMASTKNADEYISRIAMKSSSFGIYFIIKASIVRNEVITGRLKASIPNRIALMLSSEMESQNLIGEPGAESLKKHGDMVYMNVLEEDSRKSLQGTFVSDEQSKTIRDYAKEKYIEVK